MFRPEPALVDVRFPKNGVCTLSLFFWGGSGQSIRLWDMMCRYVHASAGGRLDDSLSASRKYVIMRAVQVTTDIFHRPSDASTFALAHDFNNRNQGVQLPLYVVYPNGLSSKGI